MGSMTKVMEKIREEQDAAAAAAGGTVAEAPPTEVVPDGAVAAAETTAVEAGGVVPAPDGTAPPSAFVAGENAGAAPAALDGTTVRWDPQRVDPAVIAFHDRYSAVCEQYRGVRARLLTMNAARAAQVIAITSAIPEEGKSVSTINLSLVMAEGGEHRILLADADFRRTSIVRMLGVAEQPGLAEVLSGQVPLEAALQPTPLPNLKLLPAGRVRDNAFGELLGGPALAGVLEQFRRLFDYAFLDTPPVTTVSDVCLLAPRCDGAIVVVEMRRTAEPTVQQAVRTLQANSVKIIGAILSRFRERSAAYYEHYYSYYYR